MYLCWLRVVRGVDYPLSLFELGQERGFFLCQVFEVV